jgi:predicted ATPase
MSGSLPLALNIPAMRASQTPPGQDYLVSRDGTTLPWSVLQLEKNQPAFEEWIAHIQPAIPFVKSVHGKTTEDAGLAYIEVTYNDGLKVKSSGLSDGTLTILALSILPFLGNVPPLVTVEEPENGTHPKAIETVLESLKMMSNSQVFATTHSPIVVAVTPPAELLCLKQTRAEGVRAIWGNEHPRLVEWQGQPSLATLFSAGVL